MKIRLRTVIFSNHVEISNVPVYSCKQCRKSEVCSEVKPDLSELIERLGKNPDKQQVDFSDYNEYANLMYMASDEDRLKVRWRI